MAAAILGADIAAAAVVLDQHSSGDFAVAKQVASRPLDTPAGMTAAFAMGRHCGESEPAWVCPRTVAANGCLVEPSQIAGC